MNLLSDTEYYLINLIMNTNLHSHVAPYDIVPLSNMNILMS